MFSSYEAQGLRDSRLWGLWAMWPDGRNWEPLMSAFDGQNAFHFQTQLSNGDISVVEYYNQNNNSFGTALAFPVEKDPGIPPFGSPITSGRGNDAVRRGIWWFDDSHPNHKKPRYKKFRFSPPGIYSLSAFSPRRGQFFQPQSRRRLGRKSHAAERRAGQRCPHRLVARSGQRPQPADQLAALRRRHLHHRRRRPGRR